VIGLGGLPRTDLNKMSDAPAPDADTVPVPPDATANDVAPEAGADKGGGGDAGEDGAAAAAVEATAEPEAEAEPDAEPEAGPEVVTEPGAEAESEPEPEPEPEPEAEPEAAVGPKPGAEPEAEPEAEPDAEPEAEPETEPEAEPKAEPEAEPEPDPEVEPEGGPAAEPEAEPEAAAEAEPEAEPEAEVAATTTPVEGGEASETGEAGTAEPDTAAEPTDIAATADTGASAAAQVESGAEPEPEAAAEPEAATPEPARDGVFGLLKTSLATSFAPHSPTSKAPLDPSELPTAPPPVLASKGGFFPELQPKHTNLSAHSRPPAGRPDPVVGPRPGGASPDLSHQHQPAASAPAPYGGASAWAGAPAPPAKEGLLQAELWPEFKSARVAPPPAVTSALVGGKPSGAQGGYGAPAQQVRVPALKLVVAFSSFSTISSFQTVYPSTSIADSRLSLCSRRRRSHSQQSECRRQPLPRVGSPSLPQLAP
jgi:chemotaxis protein histidine kinase CheA